MKIKSIKKIILDEPESYYDISVEKYNNFIINESMVVHNCFYHHGNTSLENAIINMAQSFKNNAPLLEEDGQFGSLRSPEAGAPRYIGTKLSENFRLLYKDFELLEFKKEEGELIEPYYFLPIIPTILLNGSSGIAVGFSSNILNRDIKSIVGACKKVLNEEKIKDISPCLSGFKGDYIQDTENTKKWYIRGKYSIKNATTIHVNELPPSMTYEKYDDLLDKLVEEKSIVAYDNNCKDDINYVIKFNKGIIGKLTNEEIIKLLKLEETSTEIFSTLDEHGKLKIFENTTDMIEYFVNFRLLFYDKRKQYFLDKMRRELSILGNRGKFIKAILEDKLKINNISKEKIISQIETLKLDKIDESYDYLLRMPIYSLTKEMFEKLKIDFVTKKEEIKQFELIKPKSMYVDDLDELIKKFK